MTEQELLKAMVAPGTPRPGKYRQGVIQIHVTRACDKSCYNCTQGSNLAGKTHFMPPEIFERAVLSLKGYFGVYGVFGGNPCLSPYFIEYCDILRRLVPKNQCGLWSNNPIKPVNAQVARLTFDPSISNLNVHLDRAAYAMFKEGWPECGPVGLDRDSRHSPPFVAMRDVIDDDSAIRDLIADCDINKHWSAMLGMFRGELRAWFCEIAGAQSILHQDETLHHIDNIKCPHFGIPRGIIDYGERDRSGFTTTPIKVDWSKCRCYSYPDTGLDITRMESNPSGLGFCYIDEKTGVSRRNVGWWQLPMSSFTGQVRRHCFDCGVPLRGHGELAQAQEEVGVEQCSETHKDVYRPKRKMRMVELVTDRLRLGKPLESVVRYLQNSEK